MALSIKDIQVYIPEKKIQNCSLADQFDFDEDFLKNKLGIIERGMASAQEACSDMALAAARQVLEKNHLNPDQIGLLILCTQNPDYKLPGTSHIVQNQLGISINCPTFDVNLGCSGFVYLLAIAKSFMQLHQIDKALLLTSDPYSKIIQETDRSTIPLFGDAAAATLMSKDGICEILKFTFGSDGAGFRNLIVEGGGSRFPIRADLKEGKTPSPYLHMDGREIYNFMMTRIPKDVHDCLKKNQLSLDDIDFFVFHQASKYLLESLGKRLKIPEGKIINLLGYTGNTVSSSIPICLHSLIRDHNMKGKKVLISGFGVGLSWASTVLEFS